MSLVTTRQMERALREMQQPQHPRRLEYPGMPFNGRVWVGGKAVTVPTTGVTQFLQVNFDGSACVWIASMPDPMPEDAEVFDTTQTPGDIHLPGNFAG